MLEYLLKRRYLSSSSFLVVTTRLRPYSCTQSPQAPGEVSCALKLACCGTRRLLVWVERVRYSTVEAAGVNGKVQLRFSVKIQQAPVHVLFIDGVRSIEPISWIL